MMKRNLIVLLIGVLAMGACTSAPQATPEPPTAAVPTQATAPTQPPAETGTNAESGPREVTFETDDGITLSGTLFGDGEIAAVLSHMRPSDQTAWHAFARTLADNGYTALAYDFRGYGKSGGTQELGKIDRDVRAAAAYLRAQGATRIVLIGASMGGTASAKIAASIGAQGLIVLSSPQSFQGLTVSADDLSLAGMPSLWVSSRGDPVAREVEAMHAGASEPKSFHVYEGIAHGTDIFNTPDGVDLGQRVVDFLAALSP
jgi:pimeloyl-ACP methyl ester carboxylesterase